MGVVVVVVQLLPLNLGVSSQVFQTVRSKQTRAAHELPRAPAPKLFLRDGVVNQMEDAPGQRVKFMSMVEFVAFLVVFVLLVCLKPAHSNFDPQTDADEYINISVLAPCLGLETKIFM